MNSREAFEAWLMPPDVDRAMRGMTLERAPNGDYAQALARLQWKVWQAATERAVKICNRAMPQPVANWCDAQIVESLREVAASIRS